MTRHIIAIDGIDGSGKSHFAGQLLEAARSESLAAVLVRVDDFRVPVDWSAAEADEDEVYYRDYYDFNRLQDCLRAFASGERRLMVPRFDSVAERVAGETAFDLPERGLLVLEGVFVCRLAQARSCTVVYLQTSEQAARARILARDREKGRSPTEIERRIDRRYFPSQRRYHRLYRPAEQASVVIDHESTGKPRLLRAELAGTPEPARRLLRAVLPDRAGD